MNSSFGKMSEKEKIETRRQTTLPYGTSCIACKSGHVFGNKPSQVVVVLLIIMKTL